MSDQISESLSTLSTDERLKAVDQIMAGCQHLYSKGRLQIEKLNKILEPFITLAERDPIFLAHFTSHAMMSDNKDLKLISVFANSLNDADGTPFSVGSEFKKPNLRLVSQAAINQVQSFDAKQIERLIEIANIKQTLGENHIYGTHFSRSLKTAIKKYIRYRESNPRSLEGIRKAGMANRFKNLYRGVRIAPSGEAAGILAWSQKDGKKIVKKQVFDFKGMSDLDIAKKIRDEKLPPTGVLGALPDKISPVIAVSVLEQASGDQAVILRELFDSQGLLKHSEVREEYSKKIKTAKTALDRVNKLNTEIDEDVQELLKDARSDVRKNQMGDIGKIFLHIDVSGSMTAAIGLAKEYGAIIAECIKNPEENFFWGTFSTGPRYLTKPEKFTQDGFAAALYGVVAGGRTDTLACYPRARELGCDVDIYVTDCEHYGEDPDFVIRNTGGKPKMVGIVPVASNNRSANNLEHNFNTLKGIFESHDIPVARIEPAMLKESALIVQTLKTSLVGREAIIEQILSTPLLKLPEWWESIKITSKP